MKKFISKIIAIVVILMSICTKASAQSPYAVFGDNSKMLETKKEPTPDIYRIGINASDGAAFYVYFNHSRKSVVKSLSNTYQFYIWKSKK